jgi:hypothetical protein
LQELNERPVILGPREELLAAVAAASTRRPENPNLYPRAAELTGQVLLAGDAAPSAWQWKGVRDGNRSVILPEVVVDVAGTPYALSVKGIGARPPLYGDSPIDFAFQSDFGGGRPLSGALAGARQITSEPWFGESPYGAQGELPASYSLMITGFSVDCQINGFYICPVIEVNEFPEAVRVGALSRYWYRRYEGAFLQEQRLVPSNIRIYHEAELTLGTSPSLVLEAVGVRTPEAADDFIENYIASGVAALTVYVRTMRRTPWGFRGLDYGDVYLDKDAVIAPDGRLYFVDIEGLDWILGGADVPVEERVREQFNYNYYEFMYGLDLLLRARERLADHALSQGERRQALAARFPIALARDPFTRIETNSRGVDVVVRPPFEACPDVPIRVLDLR